MSVAGSDANIVDVSYPTDASLGSGSDLLTSQTCMREVNQTRQENGQFVTALRGFTDGAQAY